MKKLNLVALLLGAVLFLAIGATTASAQGMKCGAGKCGSSMKASAGKSCDDKNCRTNKKCKCENKKAVKCGNSKKALKDTSKCGKGKCS